MSHNNFLGETKWWKLFIVSSVVILAITLGLVYVTPAATRSIQASPDDSKVMNNEPGAGYSIYLPMLSWPRTENVIGMQMEPVVESAGLNQVAETQTYWVGGVPVLWYEVEGTRGVYNWTTTDQRANQMKNASNEGLSLIVNVRGTPSWAQRYSGYYCGPMQSQYFDEFAEFMRQLITRYSYPPYNVKYWEIWNEPDIYYAGWSDPTSQYGCWGDASDSYYGGGYYADMLKVVYPAIKSANPNAQVLVGGLLMDCNPNKAGISCKSTKFFEGIVRNGGGPYFDGVSYHAYDYYSYAWGASYEDNLGTYQNNTKWSSQWNTTGPVFIEKASYLNSILSKYGVTGKYLLNTEDAINCSVCNGVPVPPYNEDPTPAFETTKAYYITQAYAGAINTGLKANLWYSLLGWAYYNTELLNSNLTEREGFIAYRVASQKLAGVSNLGSITNADISSTTGIKGYKFSYRNRKIWVVWSLDGNDHAVTLLSGDTLAAITDALGAAQPLSTSITITIKPIYIEWTP